MPLNNFFILIICSPVSGRMYRHGPALATIARDNKEIPAVKAVFAAFQQYGGFPGLPPPQFLNEQSHLLEQQIQEAAAEQASTTAATEAALANSKLQMESLPPLFSPGGGLFGQPQLPTVVAPAQPPFQQSVGGNHHTNTASDPNAVVGQSGETSLVRDAQKVETASMTIPSSSTELPSRKATRACKLPASTGHGFITSLVTKELQSSAPPLVPLPPVNAAAPAQQQQLQGVSRDSWSLSFDVHVTQPPSVLGTR